jgi:hypothetical protein
MPNQQEVRDERERREVRVRNGMLGFHHNRLVELAQLRPKRLLHVVRKLAQNRLNKTRNRAEAITHNGIDQRNVALD